jgi:hypothetical protein
MRDNQAKDRSPASEPSTGKFPVHGHGKFRITRRLFIVWNAGTLSKLYADRKSAPKAIADDADVSPRTAEGWLGKKNAPHSVPLTNLLFNNAQYEAEYRRLRTMEREFDPDFMRDLVAQVTREIRGE